MATPITWQFVDQPVASPTVLLDMNNGSTTRVEKPGPQTPTPQLNRSFASNAMTDGGILSSASYQNRELKFTVWLNGANLSAKISQLDALKAQLAKPSNLIMYVPPGWSFPVFFRTFRSDDYVVDNGGGVGGAEWRVNCNVIAEPFAIGARRDLTQVTVTNNPASGTNPILWDMTGIAGDSPTPAFVKVGTALAVADPVILAQRTVNQPTTVTAFAQAEAGTMGTDTTTQANDANMSGASNNFTRTTFTTASLTTRVTVTLPTATAPEALRGRYRVFVRVRTSATGSNFTLRYVQNAGGNDFVNGPITSFDSLANTAFRHIDLGVIDVPTAGPYPTTIGYSALSAQMVTQALAIQAGRNSGTATIDMDYVYLMPADERLCVAARNTTQASSSLIIDGPNEMAYGQPSGATPFGSTRTVDNAGGLAFLFGGAPMLVPNVTNRWHLIRGSSANSVTSTVDVSYWPRWREVATS